mmetsp:Transcript_8224/g.15245  ORF Transcript_8224/g.15245 Transcript_8224/m.15245 type:complete len:306 (+) Transcript_8224:775-1692(+)
MNCGEHEKREGDEAASKLNDTRVGQKRPRKVDGKTSYYDDDFPWEEVASTRQDRCSGEAAPSLAPEEEVKVLTNREVLADKWEVFYQSHTNKFFKTRSYLANAFPVIVERTNSLRDQDFSISELGCGAGASIIPLLQLVPNIRAHVVDVSATAVESLQAQLGCLQDRCKVGVCDIVRDVLPMSEMSMDFVLCVFTLSAITPSDHFCVLEKAIKLLKPGGYFLLRDYGLYDMVQTRCQVRLGENQYLKQDGIQCYFFSKEYFETLVSKLSEDVEIVQLKYCTVRNINRKKQQNIDRVFLNVMLRKR